MRHPEQVQKSEVEVKLSRAWAMPSIWTFRVMAFKELVDRYLTPNWVDPFAGQESPCDITNDIEGRGAKFSMDALEFLRLMPNTNFDGAIFDPPYSVEQCLRRYTPKHKGTAGRAEYWARCKDEVARILKVGAIVISFGWDSCGLGKTRGFQCIEVKIVCHGACHNDTLVTVERKVQ